MSEAMPVRTRREPPPFRPVVVRRVERLGPRMARVELDGDGLEPLTAAGPAASVRLLLPPPGGELVVPGWAGNEFLLPDGQRPVIRTLTPLRADGGGLAVQVVLHGAGAAATWAAAAEPGAPAAVSGPGRGHELDPAAGGHLLAGDETALPAIGQLLEAIPSSTPVEVVAEIAEPAARIALPDHPRASVDWRVLPAGGRPGDAMVAAVEGKAPGPGWKVWAAGEAAAVQRIRRHLFEGRGLARADATVRGYWKHGRAATGGEG